LFQAATPGFDRPMRRLALVIFLLALAAAPPALAARTRFTIRGAGFGHGIGLSQYGAYGYAVHGAGYRQIVLHYYKDTHLANAGGRTIRVLLQSGPSTIWFTGATRAAGQKLDPGRRYAAVRHGINQVELRNARGRKMAIADSPLVVSSSSDSVVLLGRAQNGVTDGRYRGRLELRPGLFGGMMAVNALPLDEYIQGVVPGEVPSSWPPAVLEAQAVVARSYALVTDAGGPMFDQYADTRSQMYTGMARETPGTNAAVNDTSGQIVQYGEGVATTYYFSTSGGETENIENVFIGHSPVPYLKGVSDPYDGLSPRHRWRFDWSLGQLDRKLGGWVKGKLRSVKVLQRGVSPRIVTAKVIGTRGSTQVTGPQLRTRLGLYDTWAYFIAINSGQQRDTSGGGDVGAGTGGGALTDGGGTSAGGARAARASWVQRLLRPLRPRRLILSGSVSPRPRHITVAWLVDGQWQTLGRGETDRLGRYALLVPKPGAYRVLAGGAVGPIVRIR
jgi:stage II sporulation protein D